MIREGRSSPTVWRRAASAVGGRYREWREIGSLAEMLDEVAVFDAESVATRAATTMPELAILALHARLLCYLYWPFTCQLFNQSPAAEESPVITD